jgi:hypothetical protein
MKELNGLYMHLQDGIHGYGIQAINNPAVYAELERFFYRTNSDQNSPLYGKWFRQGDSAFPNKEDKSWLFIEFLGQDLDDDSALAQCEAIARSIGCELQIL